MNRFLLAALVFSLFVSMPSAIAAPGVATGKITQVLIGSCPNSGATPPSQSECAIVVVRLSVPTAAPLPACVTTGASGTNGYEWAFAANTAGGKAMLTGIFTAQALGTTVQFVGDGTCDAWAARERLSYFWVFSPI
jgi:hypothetical protein